MRRLFTLLLLVCCSYGLFAQITVTIGTGTVNNTATGYPAPYGNYYYGARHQMLIPASEILAAGGYTGNINALQFDVVTPSGASMTAFEIKLGTTTATALGTWQTMPTTSVFYAATYTDVTGWNTHTFTTPYFWDGINSLIIETCFNNTAYINNAVMNQSTTTYTSTMWVNQDAAGVCALTGTNNTMQRPNVKLSFGPSMVLNAGMSMINSPTPPAAPGTHNVTATLNNYGSATLTSATIGWSVDGVSQSPFAWTGSLAQGQGTATPVSLGSYTFPGGVHTLKVWSSAPNLGIDEYPANDTATMTTNFATPLTGTYTIGGTGADYPTIAAAHSDLTTLGITGPVIFNINSGTYTEQLTFPEILGASDINTITFKSTTGNADDVIWQFTGTSAANFTFKLNGGDYYRFKYLTIKNLDATNGRVIDLTGGAHYNIFESNKIYSGGASNSSTSCIYDGNTLNNYNQYLYNYMSGGYYTMYLYGVSSSSWEKGTVVKGNEIVGSYYYPIYMYYCDSVEVIGNYVHDGVAPYSYGIYVNYAFNYYRIVGNRVNIVGTSSSACYGIRDYYCNYYSYNANPTGYGLVANNMISIQGGTGTNYGIYSYYCNGTETSFNTVLITNGSATAARALYQGNTSSNTLGQSYYNNIFVNTGGGYAAYFNTTAQVSASDYNVYKSNTTSYFVYWGGNKTDLAALQTASSKDMNSLSVMPAFVSNADLHNSALATYQLGTPRPLVVDDIDGQIRNASTPCMGADEYILYNNDAGVLEMVEPLTTCAGSVTVKVSVKNYGIINLQGVTVNWSVNNVNQTPLTHSTLMAPSQVDTVTLGSFTFANNTVYDFKFWTSNPNSVADQNPANDTMVKNGIQTSLSGTYTIGTGTGFDYNTVSAAVQALVNFGVCGPVVFNIAAGTYTENLYFNNILGTSSVNTVTFKSATNSAASVTIQYAAAGSGDNYVVRLNNMSWLKFQHVTLQATGASYGYVIEILGANSNNNEFSNCVIQTGLSTSSSFIGVYCSGLNLTNNVFQDNDFIGGYYGIYYYGVSSSSRGNGINVIGNSFTDFYYYGVNVAYTDNAKINDNYLQNAANSGSIYGLRIYYCNTTEVIGNEINLAATSTHYGIYHYYNAGNATTTNKIINNVINLKGTGTSTWYGLYMYYTDYTEVYHNTVSCLAGPASSYAFYQSGGTNQNIKNNIFAHNGGGYAYYINTTAGVLSSDYNNYFSTASPLAYWGAARADLTALQTANLMDMASMQANPVFSNVPGNNLTPLSGSIDNIGTPLGVLTDVNGVIRSTTTPDVGAIEFTGIAADISIATGGYLAPGQCLSTSDSLYLKITNTIGNTINFATATTTLYWSVTGPVNSNGSLVINSGTLAPGTTMTIGGVGANLSQPGTYTLSAYVGANSVNLFQGNDTLNNMSSKIVYDPFYVQPANAYVGSTTATVPITAKSKFFPGGAFYISEMCHNKVSTGAPTVGWSALTWLMAGDYIEITGVPNSDLGGYTLQQWSTALDGTFTFPTGTVMSPTGTAIIAVGQMGSSVASPANFYYHGQGSNTTDYQSAATMGRVLLDPSNTIVDAVGYGNYSFPAAANVPSSDWSAPTSASGSGTSGFRLTAPDNNTGSSWALVNATIIQDPGVVNTGTFVPVPGNLTGFTWSHNGVVFATNLIDTTVGPWTNPGTYNYVASYVTPCGTLTDTVSVNVMLATVTGTSQICEGDSAMISISFSGTGPWTMIGSDGSGNDTFNVPTSPWVMYVNPTTTTTYTVVKFADAGNVFVNSGESITVNVTPAPVVALGTFAPLCSSAAPLTLTGGTPTGGTYSGPGVTAGLFDPSVAGAGMHTITYAYQDSTSLCYGYATQQIEVLAGPAIAVTPNHDICPGTPTTLEVILPGSATGVFFSEYIEGSSNNKAIEIFNGTPDTVLLANYRIGWATNGGGWASYHTFPAGAKLAPHTTWVMVANQVSSTYYDTTLADEVLPYPSIVHHNGDDARSVEVTNDGGLTWTIIDIIGDPNNDPGTAWPVAGVNNATADKTLIRKPEITHGDTSWTAVAGTDSLSAQYSVYPQNYFTNLGSHTYNAPPVMNLAYFWSNGATTSSITVSPTVATTYTVTVIDVVTNCSSVGTVVVGMKPAATVNLGPDFNVCSDKTAVIDAGTGFTSYMWSTGATTQTIVVDGAVIGQGNTVTYTVTVTNSAGCEGIDAVAVTSIDCSGIDDPNNANYLTFWPNPTDGHFFLKINGLKGDAMLTLMNAAGQAVLKENLTLSGEMVKEFHLNNLAPGIYMVRLQTKSDVITKQVIVK
ncbi:MAG TPA: lamin tail domain-containing protein [Bacteroidales bacterium]|nr:lamin tail domain-containing protein [Bacteroidales bacterium]HRZ48402.1 lamin tail domain-containing protein [Bacteroidales bacterium]